MPRPRRRSSWPRPSAVAKDQIRHCQVCFHLTEADQPLCSICRDPRRDQATVCVVEQSRDLIALEKAGAFGGVYHVLLGRLAPLSGIGPEQLTVDALAARVQTGTVRELIMATNPNLEGDGTALLVANRLGRLRRPDHPPGPRPGLAAAPWNSPTATCLPTPCRGRHPL